MGASVRCARWKSPVSNQLPALSVADVDRFRATAAASVATGFASSGAGLVDDEGTRRPVSLETRRRHEAGGATIEAKGARTATPA
jgi:hypothetical protein